MRGQSATEYIIIGALVLVIATTSIEPLTDLLSVPDQQQQLLQDDLLQQFDIAIQNYLASPYCTWIQLRNNEVFPIQVLNVSFNNSLLSSGHLPLTLQPNQLGYVLSCDYTPNVSTTFDVPLEIRYRNTQVNQIITQGGDDFRLLGVAGLPANQITSSTPILGEHTVAIHHFDSSTTDQSEYKNNASTGTANFTNGIINQGVGFDAGIGQLQIPYSDTLNPGNFSFAMWVYVEGASTDTTNRPILTKGSSDIANSDYHISLIGNGGGQFAINATFGNGSQSCSNRSNYQVTHNTWTHIALTLAETQGDKTLRYFINGNEDTVAGCFIQGLANATEDVYIGGFGGTDFVGIIDQLVLWNKTATREEIRSHYLRGGNGTFTDVTLTYNWTTGDWGRCIDCIDAGIQIRDIYCEIVETGAIVDDGFCVGLPEPDYFQECTVGAAPSQTFFRVYPDSYNLANLSNMRVWNHSDILYPLEITYTGVFLGGRQFNVEGVNPYVCNATNVLFEMSDNSTGSKVQVEASKIPGSPSIETLPHNASYPFVACYGDLVCQPRIGACNIDERKVVGLSAYSNAKVELRGAYPINLCCKSDEEFTPDVCELLE